MWTHFLIHHYIYDCVFNSNPNIKEMWLKSINILIDSKSLRVIQGYHCYLIGSNDSIDLVMASSAWEWESNWLRFTMKQFGNSSHNCSLITNIRYWTCQIHHRKIIPMHFLNLHKINSRINTCRILTRASALDGKHIKTNTPICGANAVRLVTSCTPN